MRGYYVEADGSVRSVGSVEDEISDNRKSASERIFREKRNSGTVSSLGIPIGGSRLVRCPCCNAFLKQSKADRHISKCRDLNNR